jgi:magnesium-transporting ATPase (P-type)
VIGILSLILLAAAILARYTFHLSGAWSRTYVITAAISLYLNVFVLIVQSFEKVPSLHALAPTQKELPFTNCATHRTCTFRCAYDRRCKTLLQR